MLRKMRRPLALLALTLLGFSGCFGSCNPGGLRESTKLACVEAPPPSGVYGVQIGSSEGGKDFASLAGAKLNLDYGPQGGMHFFYSLRIFGAHKGSLLRANFYPKGSSANTSTGAAVSGSVTSSAQGTGGGGGAFGAGGAGGGSASGTGGAGGEVAGGPEPCLGGGDAADCYETSFLFLDGSEYAVPSCSAGAWLELRNKTFIVNRDGPIDGTLVVELGTCAAQGCKTDANGNYRLDVQATAQVDMGYVP